MLKDIKSYKYNKVPFSDLLGETFQSVEYDKKNEEIIFMTNNFRKLKLYHDVDCCESVYVESIIGDLQDIVNSPITLAEETTGETPADYIDEIYESNTWTFYKLATVKGYVDIRWLGTSNGYYSESVEFEECFF